MHACVCACMFFMYDDTGLVQWQPLSNRGSRCSHVQQQPMFMKAADVYDCGGRGHQLKLFYSFSTLPYFITILYHTEIQTESLKGKIIYKYVQ